MSSLLVFQVFSLGLGWTYSTGAIEYAVPLSYFFANPLSTKPKVRSPNMRRSSTTMSTRASIVRCRVSRVTASAVVVHARAILRLTLRMMIARSTVDVKMGDNER